jgi:hypothetical protein
MPKRWRVVAGGSFTWEFYDTETGEVLDRSGHRWDRRRQVRERIREMRDSDLDDDDDDDEGA